MTDTDRIAAARAHGYETGVEIVDCRYETDRARTEAETGTWPHGTQHHEAARTPAGPDARQRAAGERDEEMDR